MKKKLLSLLLLLLLNLVLGDIAMAQNSTKTDTAQKFILMLKGGQFADAEKAMDAKMKSALGGDKLSATWKSVVSQFGDLKIIAETRESDLGAGYKNYVLVSDFEKKRMDLQVAIDPQGAVCGFFIKEHFGGFVEPPYADRSKFSEAKVTVGKGEFALDGTLSIPAGAGPFPAVVLVHGSGPNDQDETLGGLKVFRDLAWGLSSRGIAVLRYNKRSFQHAQKMLSLVDKLTVKEEAIDDAVAALETLKANSKIDKTKMFILGHSLGGMLMPRIAADARDAAGFIIMAGSTRKLEDMIVDQFEYIYAQSGMKSAEQESDIAKLKVQAAKVKDANLSSATPAKDLPLGMPAVYWLDLRAHDPATEAKAITKPLLILQGDKDYQVTSEDLDGWKKALAGRSNVSIKTYAGLGHCFTPSGVMPSPKDYDKPQNVSADVIDDIASWLKRS